MRQVARHVWIRELLDGEYEEREGWEPNVLHTGRGEVSRVNLIGTVLEMQGAKVLDDGTGQVSLRAFEQVPGFNDVESGQMVLVVGRPRVYQDSLYVIPEVIRPVGQKWALVRKQELGPVREYAGGAVEKEEPDVSESEGDGVFDNDAEKVVAIIDGLDDGDGAEVQEVVSKSELGDRAEEIVNQLLLDGEIFEIRPGVVKVL